MSVIYTGGLYALWIWAAPLLQLDRWGPQDGSPGWLCSFPTIFLSKFCSLLLTLPSWSLCCCFPLHPCRYCLQGFSPCWTACTPRLSFDISVKASMTPQVLHSSWLQNLHYLDVTKVFCLHKLFLHKWVKAHLNHDFQQGMGSESSASSVVQAPPDLTFLKYWSQIFISTPMSPRQMG